MFKSKNNKKISPEMEEKIRNKVTDILSDMFSEDGEEFSKVLSSLGYDIDKEKIQYNGSGKEIISNTIKSIITVADKVLKGICNDSEILEILIDTGFDINKKEGYIINSIISSGSTQCIKVLIDKGIDLNVNNNEVLKTAIKCGKTDIVELLLEAGADINSSDEYPIILALENHNHDLAKLLIEKGADVTVSDNLPIKLATECGYTDIIEILLNKNKDGYDIDKLLLLAGLRGNVPSIRFLLEKGADPTTGNGKFINYLTDKGYFHILADLCKTRDDITFDYEKYIMKESRIRSNQYNVLEIMECMKNKHQINRYFYQLIDRRDYSILKDLCAIHSDIVKENKSAVNDACRKGDSYLLSILYDAGFDIGFNNYQPFIDAAGEDHIEIVKFYIRKGTDIQLRDNLALKTAVRRKAYDVTKLLIKEGANMYANDNEILHNIIKDNNVTMLSILLDNGLEIDIRDDDFDNPIDSCIISGKIDIIKLLLNKGIDVNYNNRALKMAALENKADILKLLFENGASPEVFSIKDIVDLTTSGKMDVVKVIAEYKKSNK